MNEGQLDIWVFFAIVDSLAFRVVCYWGNLCSNFLPRGNGGRGGNGQDGKAKLISSSFLSSYSSSSWSSSCAQLPTAFLMGGSTQSPKEKRENFIFGRRGGLSHFSHSSPTFKQAAAEEGKGEKAVSNFVSSLPFPHISRSDGKIKKVKQDLQCYFPFDSGEEEAKM